MTSRQASSRTRGSIKATLDLKVVGRRIREIRGFNLSQVQFSSMLGISQTQLSKYELGQSAPTPEIMLKLKAYSGKSVDWILTGEELSGRH